MNNIKTIIDKEWLEVFKNRFVLFTVMLLPVLFTILPLVMLFAMRSSGELTGSTTDVPPSFMAACGNLAPEDCIQVFMINQFLLMFMLLPLAIPVAIAAYSVVVEKTTRSLEPLLATPITTVELLAGKSAAAVIPAIAATWVGFLVFVLTSPLVGIRPAVHAEILSPTWLIAIGIVGPLMAVMAVNFALIVSSRVNDPRAAEQISMVVIVPLLGLIFGQIAGVLVLNVQLMVSVAIGIAVVDVALIYLGARLFQREVILTRWK